MGKWTAEMKRVVGYSERMKKQHEDKRKAWSTLGSASQAVAKSTKSNVPRLEAYIDEMLSLCEEIARTTAELSVYEDELKEAKRDKDKQRELTKKMKPLAAKFERSKKKIQATHKNYVSDERALRGLLSGLRTALAPFDG